MSEKKKVFSVGVTPLKLATRPVVQEPLTVDDWRCVWLAYQGFLQQVRLIVDRARDRQGHYAPKE